MWIFLFSFIYGNHSAWWDKILKVVSVHIFLITKNVKPFLKRDLYFNSLASCHFWCLIFFSSLDILVLNPWMNSWQRHLLCCAKTFICHLVYKIRNLFYLLSVCLSKAWFVVWNEIHLERFHVPLKCVFPIYWVECPGRSCLIQLSLISDVMSVAHCVLYSSTGILRPTSVFFTSKHKLLLSCQVYHLHGSYLMHYF